METISVSEAKNRFSKFLSRAAGGERFVIMRRAHPLAVLISIGELKRLQRSAKLIWRLAQALGQSPQLLKGIEAGKVHPAMAASGLWKNEKDLDDLEIRIINNRHRASSRADL